MSMTAETDAARPGMRAKFQDEYATLIRTHEAHGPFLEIPHASRDNAVSLSPHLAGQERHVVVRNGGGETDGVQFHKGSANDLTELFDDGVFSTVIWDRALDRDPRFWLTLAEIKRVLMPGGLLIVCTRGFGKANKFGVKVSTAKGKEVAFMTATGSVTTGAADFWRLSPQAMRRVIFEGFDVREVRTAFMVPHLFGVAAKQS